MRILIAEQNREFRAEFVELITHCHANWQIVQVGDAMELRTRLGASRYDVVFLDLQLPGLQMSSPQRAEPGACLDVGALRAGHPHAKFIGLGDTNDGATIIRCFEDGLGGYIARGCSGIKLIRTLKVIATPDLFISTGGCEPARTVETQPPAISWGMLQGMSKAKPNTLPLSLQESGRDGAPSAHALTARQADVLNLLAEGRSTKDIARRLGLAVPTVKTHLAAVYRQLGARNRLQAVVKAGALPAQISSLMRNVSQREMFEGNFIPG